MAQFADVGNTCTRGFGLGCIFGVGALAYRTTQLPRSLVGSAATSISYDFGVAVLWYKKLSRVIWERQLLAQTGSCTSFVLCNGNEAMNSQLSWTGMRPMANAHWALPIGILAFWLVDLVAIPCRSTPHYLEAALASACVVCTFWAADLRRGPIGGWRRITKVVVLSIQDILRFVALWLLLGFPIVIFMPAYDCYSERSYVSEALSHADSIQTAITTRAVASGTLKNSGAGLNVALGSLDGIGIVSSDGTILIALIKPNAVVTITPQLSNGAVKWQCKGRPTKWVPVVCRE